MIERSQNADLSYAVRPGNASDVDFITSTWLRSHKHSGYGVKRISAGAYFERHHAVVERILTSGARVCVAADIEDEKTILGYSVTDAMCWHWVYVKKPFRRFGIATRLLRDADAGAVAYSYLNDSDACHALVKKYPKLAYNPYATEPPR